MRTGISTYTFPWRMGGRAFAPESTPIPIPSLFERAKALPGVEVIQICDHPGLDALSETDSANLRALAEKKGLALQIGTRGIDSERLTRHLAIAADLGAGLVRTILPMSGPGSDYGGAARLFREILPDYERKNIHLSLENHDKNPAAALRRLVEDVASPVFGICLDTVNSYGIGEDSRRILDALAPVTNCFHAKDYRIGRIDCGLGFVLTGAPAGEGMLNIPDILERFDRAGRRPDVILEQWTPWRGSLAATLVLEEEWAVKSVAYLAGVVRKVRTKS
ncbi:MAG: sugar phosphate isomerase/epimerase [Planctomycetota bacterium]|nr:sugar phosphate isomerase/epimerase [Planctomycetota bacterium]